MSKNELAKEIVAAFVAAGFLETYLLREVARQAAERILKEQGGE